MKTQIGNYEIDSESLTCTCGDFIHRRRHFDLADPQRLCKHLQGQALKPIVTSDGVVRFPREVGERYAADLIPLILQIPGIQAFEICGSFRRMKTVIKDLDFLLCINPDDLTPLSFYQSLVDTHGFTKTRQGDKFASFIKDGFQIDFKLIPAVTWAFSTMHFTGSVDENIRLRRIALSKGFKMSEYGFNGDSQGLKTEQEIYEFLGQQFKNPWDR